MLISGGFSISGGVSVVQPPPPPTEAPYGWFGGGTIAFSGLRLSRVDRIDYNNDTVTASIRGPLSGPMFNGAATGNPDYGWFGGGRNQDATYISRVNRIDYANDLATAGVRGPLSSTKYALAATGNVNYGWFGGGYTDSPFSDVSRVDRIDYINDTANTSIRGPLSLARRNLTATGNSNFGWFCGGRNSPEFVPISIIDRIDYISDTGIAFIRGPASLAKWGASSTGNQNFGWFGGGYTPTVPAPTSRVDRIDYANDLATAAVRGPLSVVSFRQASTGNSNFGWFGGVGSGSASHQSTVNRIDYNNDTVTASIRGPLNSADENKSAAGGFPG
jgi:hypothetical protein